MSASMKAIFRAVEWIGDETGHVRLLDQTRLPAEVIFRDCRTVEEVWEAIKTLRVRGAPAIGIATAMGVVVGMQTKAEGVSSASRLCEVANYLRTSRPTAVNLFWAIERLEKAIQPLLERSSTKDLCRRLLADALAIELEDRQMCRSIGHFGAALVRSGDGILTHCNAGGLATSEYGTALAVVYAAADAGKTVHVFADETRPLLQGARLTTWELMRAGIDVTLICDSMAAQVMKERRIHLVVVGADRIAANGDTANKIGTYGVAILARAHGIPFYVAAPSSTFDFSLEDGSQIPIEQRDPREVTDGLGISIAPPGVQVYNPAFDVTPAELISGIITEKGIITPVHRQNIDRMLHVSNQLAS